MRAKLLFLAVAAGFLAGCSLSDPNSCESRCSAGDEPCMRAIDNEGIAPYGSTKGDQGVCNGICSALRTSERTAAEQYKELGEPLPVHACLRPAE